MIKCPNYDNHDNGHHTTKIISHVKVVQVPGVQQPQEIPQGYWDVTTTCCYSHQRLCGCALRPDYKYHNPIISLFLPANHFLIQIRWMLSKWDQLRNDHRFKIPRYSRSLLSYLLDSPTPSLLNETLFFIIGLLQMN